MKMRFLGGMGLAVIAVVAMAVMAVVAFAARGISKQLTRYTRSFYERKCR